MSWKVAWSNQALKDASRLDDRTTRRVFDALDRLATTGHGDVKRLRGHPREWRLRVGAWRVRLVFNDATNTIEVQRVLPRGRAYRD